MEKKQGLMPVIDKDSRILILGTMPGERSIALQQYYGNRGNYFWRILFRIFGIPFSTVYEDRLHLLRHHHIALWNVLASCERTGSADSAIRNEQANNFEWLHQHYPDITHIYFESKSAERYFIKHCKYKDGITYTVMPSTSGLNAGMPFEEKFERWQKIAAVIP